METTGCCRRASTTLRTALTDAAIAGAPAEVAGKLNPDTPSRRLAKWRWISIGSVFAALTWLAVSSLFSWYLGSFANYNATYGALEGHRWADGPGPG